MKTYQAIVIGTGCAGYATAERLYDLGVRDIAILTEGRTMGTSRNTGSDKQTYYKLSLAGSDGDSVREMAETLYAGGGVMGEHALCEVAYSVRAFMHLVELGVPFPTNGGVMVDSHWKSDVEGGGTPLLHPGKLLPHAPYRGQPWRRGRAYGRVYGRRA